MPSFNLKGKVSLDSTEFQAGLRRVKLASAATAKTIGQGFRQIGGAIQRITASLAKFAAIAGTITFAAATAGAIKLGRELRKAFELGGGLSDLSSRTGIAVKDLVVLQQAFEDAGAAGDQVGITLNRLTRRTQIATQGNNAYSKALETLGLNAEKLARMDQASRFWEVANAMNRLGINSETTAAAMDLLDTSAGQLFGLFQDAKALENASKTIGTQADILDKNAQTFDRIADLLNSAGKKLQGFFVGIASVAAPKILEVLEKFNNLDLAQLGQNIAQNLNMENALEIMKASFNVAASFLGNAVFKALVSALTAFSQLWSNLSIKLSDNLSDGLKEGLKRALISLLGPLGMVVGGADAINKGRNASGNLSNSATDWINEALDKMDSNGDVFGLSENLEKLQKVVSKIAEPASAPANNRNASNATLAGTAPAVGAGHHTIDEALARGMEKAAKRSGPPSRIDQHREMFGNGMALMPALPSGTAASLSAFEQLQANKAAGIAVGANGIGASGLQTGGLGVVRAVGKKAADEATKDKQTFRDTLAATTEQVNLLEEQNDLLREGLTT